MKKTDLPVHLIRRYLEPGPIVLVSSAYKGERNIMSMGWHMVMEFSPSRIGCFISPLNHSFEMIRKSKQCVINVPTADMLNTVIDIGNCSGTESDKFEKFKLTAQPASKVKAPLIGECYANYECVLEEYIKRYNLFIFTVVKAHVAKSPKYPETVHYRGDGIFMISGRNVNRKSRFKPQNL